MSDWPTIEYEESYPIGEEQDDWNPLPLDAYPIDIRAAAAWVLGTLTSAAENMCCVCCVSDDKDKYSGNPVKKIDFSTLGWSGAESIIRIIESRFDTNYFTESWRRGGHYVFIIPESYLSPTPTETQG